ncbi:pleckstrin homology domain-containing protein [Elsinoe australis]|uniref:Pleckstrin homology domain-containing protein n=1 Tax=Elsinoe australis TaxID=40998 RepID=A0A4V6DTM4_9PEZI|nr:pleckstrin homology domain-containing protein [Elsinoe australis]
MSSAEPSTVLQQDASLTAAINLLGPKSYTAQRLQHADAEHLHLTTRRCFIGPIPEGWLKSNRKQWYKHYLGINHSSKRASFSAPDNVGAQRRMTVIDGPTRPSFPQPADAVDGAAGSSVNPTEQIPATDHEDEEAIVDAPPGVSLPRGSQQDQNTIVLREHASNTKQPVSKIDTDTTKKIDTEAGLLRKKAKKQDSKRKNTKKPPTKRQASATSFKTARENLEESQPVPIDSPHEEHVEETLAPLNGPNDPPGISVVNTDAGSPRNPGAMPGSLNLASPSSPTLSGLAGSTASLLRADQGDLTRSSSAARPLDQSRISDDARRTSTNQTGDRRISMSRAKVQFHLPDAQSRRAELQVRARFAQAGRKAQGRIMTRGRFKSGEIIKMEKMLLRVDIASGSEQPEADFTEKDSRRVETRVVEKWREFMVVCRESSGKPKSNGKKSEEDDEIETVDTSPEFTLQMYQTRVIPASNQSKTKRRFKHEIPLDRATVRINLYSSLDKTIAICVPEAHRTRIFFLRTRSGTSSVEWFHFLRQILGLRRARTIQINIPDLGANVRLDNPFDRLIEGEDLEKAAEGDEEALNKSLQAESSVAKNIIDRCLTMLAKGEEWNGVLEAWANHDHIGLCWKRYDRIEWVHGEHERKMYGANAMLRTHDLELRSKQHYPQTAKNRNGKAIAEPAPVEGFLVRLTSQKGAHQRLGKYFFKRLYFTSHNQFLVFLRPGQARPPPPPTLPMTENSAIPSAGQLSAKIPLIYAVNPYPTSDSHIDWLDPSSATHPLHQHDTDASDEASRVFSTLHNSDGFINLTSVLKVRPYDPASTASDATTSTTPDSGSNSDVDFDEAGTASASRPDGTTNTVDVERTFELVLRNGLVIRLQAFNRATSQEWILRLRALVKYWTARATADTSLFRTVRHENLRALNIDERAEAEFGQFAAKWEVGKSFASPELYNLCGISGCRSVHVAGQLYRKKRVHATFEKVYVILCRGKLLLFRDTERKATGKKVEHIYHERIGTVDLEQCYLYSGLITENDLLYQNRTFDSNAPGNTALPRLWRDDEWSSTDEDPMTTFALWHGARKGWFWNRDGGVDKEGGEGGVKGRLKRVNQLGVKGRSMVFKARSRAERDHWVLAIAAEIERVARDDGVRLVGKEEEKK